MAAIDLQRISQCLPLFPLPSTVLLPGELLPLHVFEPRYRALVAHCFGTDGILGIATLKSGYEEQYEDRPPIHPEIGVGRLVDHQPFPDGRSNVLVEFVGGVHLEEELPARYPFREISGRVMTPDTTGTEAAFRRLQVLVLQLGALSPDAATEASRLVQLDEREMVDSLARKLLDRPDDRRAYLAQPSVVERVGMVQDRLSTFLTMSGASGDA